MRGHWLSTTRKLNRHYQSGVVGGTQTLGEVTNTIIAPTTTTWFDLTVNDVNRTFNKLLFGTEPNYPVTDVALTVPFKIRGTVTGTPPVVYFPLTGNYNGNVGVIPSTGGTYPLGYYDLLSDTYVSTGDNITITKLADGQYKITTDSSIVINSFSWQYTATTNLVVDTDITSYLRRER